MNGSLVRAGVVAAATTALLAPVVRARMVRTGVLDVPNHRSSHAVPVPRGGGLAALGGVLAGAAGACSPGAGRAVLAAAALSAVGYADDRSGGVPAGTRLMAQATVGAITSGPDPSSRCVGVLVMPSVVNVVQALVADMMNVSRH